MGKKLAIATVMLVALLSLMVLSCGQKQEQTGNSSVTEEQPAAPTEKVIVNLDGIEKQVIDTLLVLWQIQSNLTSFDQAAAMLGVDVTDSMRIEMMTYLEKNMTISKRLARYRPYTFTLTNREKLIASYLFNYERTHQEFPTFKKFITDLNLNEEEAQGRLKFLTKINYMYDLGGPNEYNQLGYSFGSDRSSFVWDMGLKFHAFYVEDQLPFNVGCAKEAFFDYLRKFSGQKVRYETFDPYSLDPITVVFEDLKVKSVSPEGAKILEGGTCGTNNLFVSEENAIAWSKTIPYMKNPNIFDIKSRLEEIKELMNDAQTDH